MKLVVLTISAIALASCATTSQLAQFTGAASPNAANFKYVNSVTASGTAVYFLGFGGATATENAFDSLKEKANLAENQALVNVTVLDNKRTVFGNALGGLIQTVTVKVKADVIEFTK